MKGKFIFVLGGTRSGKSEFAEKIAGGMGYPVTYIATADIADEEMAARVKRHKERRPHHWKTVEEPKDVATVVSKGLPGETFLLDCVTVWISNLFFGGNEVNLDDTLHGMVNKELFVLEQVQNLVQAVRKGINLVAVAGEVGLGVVPAEESGRIFRDLAGKVNQLLASSADEVYFVVAGVPLKIKPGEKSLQQFFPYRRRRLKTRGVLFY